MQVRTYFYPTDDPEEVSLDDYYMYCCLQLEPFEPAETRINTVLNVLNDTSESSSYTFLIENDLTSSNVLHGTYPYFVRGSVVFKNYYASQHIVELELNEVVFRSLAGNSEFMNGTLYCRYTSLYDASPVSWSW